MNKTLMLLFAFLPICILEGQKPTDLSLQGHRGARGLFPENTIEGLIHALQYSEVNTLEFDLAVSKDEQILLSHEPWFNDKICIHDFSDSLNNIYSLEYHQLKMIDCGSKKNSDFPESAKFFTNKPLLAFVLDSVMTYCKDNNQEIPFLNIELKSKPSWYGVFCPEPNDFVKLVEDLIVRSKYPKGKIIFQSFDPEILKSFKRSKLNWTLSYLVEFKTNPNRTLKTLGFYPEIISPNYRLVNKKWIKQFNEHKIQTIPWTVNNTEDMKQLLEIGVDGLISDFPNLYKELNN